MGSKIHNIADVLFSKTQQLVLSLFFVQPDHAFYTNEIIRLSRVGTGTVLREPAKLSYVGLITIQKVGNQKLYKANRALI